jgi:hypothetical protein
MIFIMMNEQQQGNPRGNNPIIAGLMFSYFINNILLQYYFYP